MVDPRISRFATSPKTTIQNPSPSLDVNLSNTFTREVPTEKVFSTQAAPAQPSTNTFPKTYSITEQNGRNGKHLFSIYKHFV